MPELATLRLEREGPIAHLALNRPAQLNAINRQMLEDLAAACEIVEKERAIKVVALTGEGRAFCAGADLRTVQELSPDPKKWEEFIRLWHRTFNRIEALPMPVIAGVHGMALAGGLELTMVADLVIADEEAKLGDQHANFGLVAGGGGTQRQLAALSGSANRTVKTLANRGLDLPLADGLELEIRTVGEHMQSADAREGLAAFVEKRKPKFT